MSTTLHVHTDSLPAFEFTDFGYFTAMRVKVTTKPTGEVIEMVICLPEGMTHANFMKAVSEAEIKDAK